MIKIQLLSEVDKINFEKQEFIEDELKEFFKKKNVPVEINNELTGNTVKFH